jgi:hypothetical protein
MQHIRQSGFYSILSQRPTGNLADMSLQKNVAGQNITFGLLNATDGSPLTGATISGFISKDGVQAAATNANFTELTPTGQAIYNSAITQAETNANSIGLLVTAPNAVPFNLIFLIGGLKKNSASPQQHIPFAMLSQASVGDPSATVTVKISKDGGSLATGVGTVTNLGNFQYDYAPTAAETNGNGISYSFSSPGDITQTVFVFPVP